MSDLPALMAELDGLLAPADAALAAGYPGEPNDRQPVHTVYVPADAFAAETPFVWGREALRLVAAHGVPRLQGVPETLWPRVEGKLASEPVEDLRVDFEDGYGARPDAEEDGAARAVASALVALAAARGAPPFLGVRIKSLEAPTRRRGVQTLDLLLEGLGTPPPGFIVTLPKVTSVDQVAAMVLLCDRLEDRHGLPTGRLRFEIQVETPQAVLGADGTATVASMIHAAAGRCVGLHYGTYDYSASLGIAAGFQSLEHPVADHAKAVMQVAAAGTGVRVCDGSTNVIPVGDGVAEAWALHGRLVRRSLERGYYQGWDMHPGHLPTRYLATYGFFAEGAPGAAARVRAYLDRVAGGVMDEPATALALASFLLRGLDCGALDAAALLSGHGLDRASLQRLARRRP